LNVSTTFSKLGYTWPIPVAARSKAWVCGRSLTGIVGSNPAGVMDVCLLRVLCVARYRSLRRAGHSSRGVLPSVVCLKYVIAKPRKMRRSRPPKGLSSHRKKEAILDSCLRRTKSTGQYENTSPWTPYFPILLKWSLATVPRVSLKTIQTLRKWGLSVPIKIFPVRSSSRY
jgi:hypothetical protein